MFKMRPTTALCLLALAALIVTSTSWAQRPPSREQMEQQAARHMEELRTRLELTEEQERQIEPILAEGRRKGLELHDEFRSQERSRSTTMRDEMQKMHQQMRDELMSILTTQQLAEYDAVHEEWRAERRKKMQGHRAGQRSPI